MESDGEEQKEARKFMTDGMQKNQRSNGRKG
jgi:hypothetical protein